MAITRRTHRFYELAVATEHHCVELGREVPGHLVDAALNARISFIAERMGLTPASALMYADDKMPIELAQVLVAQGLATDDGTLAALDDYRHPNQD